MVSEWGDGMMCYGGMARGRGSWLGCLLVQCANAHSCPAFLVARYCNWCYCKRGAVTFCIYVCTWWYGVLVSWYYIANFEHMLWQYDVVCTQSVSTSLSPCTYLNVVMSGLHLCTLLYILPQGVWDKCMQQLISPISKNANTTVSYSNSSMTSCRQLYLHTPFCSYEC